MQTAVEATLAQHIWDVVRGLEQVAGGFKVAAEKQHGDNGRGHHLGIVHPGLWVFVVANAHQKVAANGKDGYDFIVHELSPFSCGVVTSKCS
jgi:hypothetical protein